MSKQDRQGVRTPADLERKYNYKSFASATGNATEANRNAHEANAAVAELKDKLAALDVEIKKIRAEIDSLGETLESIDGRLEVPKAQAVYTAMMTDTLSSTLTKTQISDWYTLSLWTEAMINGAVEKGVLTEDEAAEILG